MEQLQTSDYKIINILHDFKRIINNKNDAFALMLRLKQSIEFNASINWKELYKEISNLYNDPKPYYNSGEFTPDPIDSSTMTDTDIFVFGTNTEGRHDGGAAKAAMLFYDAVYGQARGLQGRSYGIVTIDFTGKEPVTLLSIEKEIDAFLLYAVENPQLKFWLTKIGCGISGYSISEISRLFKNKLIPSNVVVPKEFVDPGYYEEYLYSESTNTYYHFKTPDNAVIVCTLNKAMSIGEIYNFRETTPLPVDLVTITEDQFIIATETVLKSLY